MHLFVAGLDFFVGRAQLLVHRFLLFDDRLQVFARGLELLAKPPGVPCLDLRRLALLVLSFASRRFRLGLSFLEQHQQKTLPRRPHERNHFNIDIDDVCVELHFDALASRRCILRAGRVNGCAQVGEQPLARHLQKIETRRSRCRLEVAAGASSKLQHLEVIVDQHAGRRKAVQQHSVRFAKGGVRKRCFQLVAHPFDGSMFRRAGRGKIDDRSRG